MDSDGLYGLPLERFVPERGALAKQLRAAGKRDEAAAVAALRKPTIAAWAVNQLIRTQGKLLKSLFAAGDALRKAQDELLAGRSDARKLRQAAERQRAAVDELAARGRGLLTAEGDELSPAVLERVAETLQAAALDEAARGQVAGGRLERELRHAGLGFGDATPLPPTTSRPKQRAATAPKRAPAARKRPAPAARKPPAPEPPGPKGPSPAARKRAARAAQALKIADERRARAAAALEEADAALVQAREEVEAAQRELDS